MSAGRGESSAVLAVPSSGEIHPPCRCSVSSTSVGQPQTLLMNHISAQTPKEAVKARSGSALHLSPHMHGRDDSGFRRPLGALVD